MLRKTIGALLVMAMSNNALLWAQTQVPVSLETCYEQARQQYPLLQQGALNEQALALRLEQLQLQRMPQIAVQGQATFQSEAVKVPFAPPGGEPIELPLFGAKLYAEGLYSIYDGGLNKASQNLEKSQHAVMQQSVEVDMYRLYDQVNKLYFGILLTRAQDSLLVKAAGTLEARQAAIGAAVKHGVALPSEADRIAVEILRLQAQRTELNSRQRSLLATLNTLTRQNYTTATLFEVPRQTPPDWTARLNRPEVQLFALQQQQLLSQEPLISARRKPKVNAFLQAGLGYPNPLNFFDTQISPYAMAGVQLKWPLWDWGLEKKEREWLSVKSQIIDNQRQTFEHNFRVANSQYAEESAKLNELVNNDKAIAALQAQILQQISSQLDHGVATAADYIAQVNAELQAQLNLRLHELQLQQLIIDYQTSNGR